MQPTELRKTAMHRRATVIALATLAIGFTALPLRSDAQGQAADARAVREIIEAQLAAFASDDAQRAFGFASPSIQAQFGSAPVFLRMVREGYPVVYRPATVAFFVPEFAQGLALQTVRMTDADGKAWLAFYQLERQPDGSWRIGGCIVEPDRARST